MLIDFKGKSISVKEFDCKLGKLQEEPIAPFVNLFVKVTKGCNAKCLFCSNAGTSVPQTPFNVSKLIDIIKSLKESGIKVNRVNITGGEPSVVSPLVEDILSKMDEPETSGIHIHLNTNGLLPQSQELMRHPRWDSISMSLHHYDIARLSELYGCRIPDGAFYFDGIEHFVDLEDIHLDSIPHVYFTKSMNRGSDCKCSNYLYNRDLKILEIYMRNYANPNYCESSLVYDGEYLRQGFHQDNIIY